VDDILLTPDARELITTGVWSTRAPLLEPNSEIAVAQMDSKIYVIGGYPSTRISVTTVQVYDATTDSWTLTTPLPLAINHGMATAVNGKVYMIGGQIPAGGSGPFQDTVFEYDPATAIWTGRTPMPTARSGGVTGVIDGKIYVAGGRPPQGNDFAVYDPSTDSWATLPDMPTQRNHIAGAAIDGKFYVVGGRFGAGFRTDMTNVLEMFDPIANTWTTKAPMPTVRGGLNGIAVHGCFYVWGGESSNGVFPQMELYNPATDTWQSLDPIPIPVHGVTGAAFIDGWIHLPGGGTSIGGSSGSTIHQVFRPGTTCR
jgi:N-acetylneuraminic acid mutarotase